MKRIEQKEKRRQEILEYSLELFITKGFHNTKISDIAKGLNISTGLLFNYFDSKESLYDELINMAAEGPKLLNHISTEEGIDFFKIITEYILLATQSKKISAKLFILMELAYLQTDNTKALDVFNELMLLSIHHIKKGQQLNQIKKEDPTMLSSLFWLTLNGTVIRAYKDVDFIVPKSSIILSILKDN